MQRPFFIRRISVAFVLIALCTAISFGSSASAKSAVANTAPALVYGQVTKVTATTIYVKSSWMTWQVATNGKTKYLNVKNKTMRRASIRVGHSVTAAGMIVRHTYRITNVTEVNDWNVKK